MDRAEQLTRAQISCYIKTLGLTNFLKLVFQVALQHQTEGDAGIKAIAALQSAWKLIGAPGDTL